MSRTAPEAGLPVVTGQAGSIGDRASKASHRMMTMQMSSSRILALVVLAVIVLLTVAEFGPSLLD
jgi:hypothetical protein